MDSTKLQVQQYISSSRASGKSDQQITQELLAKGWTLEQIAPYLIPLQQPSGQTIPSSQKFDKRILLFIVSIFILLSFGGIISYLLISNTQKQTTSSQQSSSQENVQNDLPVVAAFVQSQDLRSFSSEVEDKIVVYDLNLGKVIEQSGFSAEADASPQLGNWSPDGSLLPILFIRESSLPHPLYLYDLKLNTAKKLFDVNDYRDQIYPLSFWFQSRWLSNNKFVTNTYIDSQSNTEKEAVIDINGQVTIQTSDPQLTLNNSRVKVLLRPIQATSSGVLVSASKVTVDGKEISIKETEQVIGILNNSLVTWEQPAQISLLNLGENSEYIDLLKSATTEEETRKIADQFLRPQGPDVLHFYDLVSQNQTQMSINDEKWLVKDVQVRPGKNTLLILQNSSSLSPYSSKIIEVSPLNPENRRTVVEIAKGVSNEHFLLSGDGFYISKDGSWLLVYEPADPLSSAFQNSIVAYNIDSGESIKICEPDCKDLKVYNSEQLRR